MLIFCLLILLLVIGIGWSGYYQSGKILQQTLEKEAANNAYQYANLINEWLNGIKLELLTLADTDAIIGMDWSTQSATLERITKNQQHIANFFVADTNGSARVTSDRELTLDIRE